VIWRVGLAGSAIRDLDRVPPRVVPAVVEFIYGPLADDPQRVGLELRDDFSAEWGARRGAYRILYRIDEAEGLVTVTRVGHRAHVYRPR
jgi:mRNA interferase RelE/StbE